MTTGDEPSPPLCMRRAHLKQLVDAKRQWTEPISPKEREKGFRGWYSSKYLPHFDSPWTRQFITYRLPDAMPALRRREWEQFDSGHILWDRRAGQGRIGLGERGRPGGPNQRARQPDQFQVGDAAIAVGPAAVPQTESRPWVRPAGGSPIRAAGAGFDRGMDHQTDFFQGTIETGL